MCATCLKVGELFCCDGCPRAFHPACIVAEMPLSPAKQLWKCPFCVAKPSGASRLDDVADAAATSKQQLVERNGYIILDGD